jgi:hypothetical protein
LSQCDQVDPSQSDEADPAPVISVFPPPHRIPPHAIAAIVIDGQQTGTGEDDQPTSAIAPGWM